ncbi:unnamed protein product [Spirodela intermedia]|uniref:DM2 domain-containing protein n=1 Tax=Spirodela intermedia TaxID=51605 RepID=A0A7I8JJ14_SPIIN|nr:unnamed protein product [Spirodela intermedia]CAA6670157.1 unnamed protein product [Spirodela intermedia]
MVSDQEIASCVESLLPQPDANGAVTSVNVSGVVSRRASSGIRLICCCVPGGRLQGPCGSPSAAAVRRCHSTAAPSAAPDLVFAIYAAPSQHDLAFRCAPVVIVQPHPLLQQQQPAAAGPAVLSIQEGHAAAGSSLPKPAKASAEARAKRRRGPGGLTKLCGVSPVLQNIVGGSTLPRTEIVKQLWAYIRKNNLQDPNNKRKIICNDELRVVFETDCTDIFMMNKLLAKHITPLEPSKEPAASKKKAKTTELPSAAEGVDEKSPVVISDELAKFFGTGEREMPQSEALKHKMKSWFQSNIVLATCDYFFLNAPFSWKLFSGKRISSVISQCTLFGLFQDPTNSKMIRCDAKLQQLLGCESLPAQGVFEMLSRHLLKQS